jgi:hypothetical protein
MYPVEVGGVGTQVSSGGGEVGSQISYGSGRGGWDRGFPMEMGGSGSQDRRS